MSQTASFYYYSIKGSNIFCVIKVSIEIKKNLVPICLDNWK